MFFYSLTFLKISRNCVRNSAVSKPAHYFILFHPSYFALDAMLLKIGVVLEPFTDQKMYEIIERGLKGGNASSGS